MKKKQDAEWCASEIRLAWIKTDFDQTYSFAEQHLCIRCSFFLFEGGFFWKLRCSSRVCVCSLLVCEHVKKRFPKPRSPPALVYLFSLMIVFLILAWLHSSAGVDCTALSLQMTSIWTVSIWHAFIYVGSRKAIFRWVSHFLSSFVVRSDQTFSVDFECTLCTAPNRVLDFLRYVSREVYHAYPGCTDAHSPGLFLGYGVAHNSTPICLFNLSFEQERSRYANITLGSSSQGGMADPCSLQFSTCTRWIAQKTISTFRALLFFFFFFLSLWHCCLCLCLGPLSQWLFGGGLKRYVVWRKAFGEFSVDGSAMQQPEMSHDLVICAQEWITREDCWVLWGPVHF